MTSVEVQPEPVVTAAETPEIDDEVEVTRPERQRRPGAKRWTALLSLTLATVAVLALGAFVYAAFLSGVQEYRSQRINYATLREQLANQTSPIGGQIEAGAPLLLLDIPELGISKLVVVEGTTSGDLEAGPGHRADTPLPGQAGVAVVMGRSQLFGGPFADVPDLERGDAITAVTGQGTFDYTVDRVRRAGDELPAPPPVNGGRLTLVTSAKADGRWAREVVYVDATLQDPAYQAPEGRPTEVSEAQIALASDDSALLPLVVWLGLLLVGIVAIVWAQGRWGVKQALLIGVPVLATLVWGVLMTSARLLPNLL